MEKVITKKFQPETADIFYADDVGAPFKVSLHKSVRVTMDPKTGDMIDYHIPDFDALVDAVIMARLMHDQKLDGAEISWLRKAAGLKQIDLAKAVGVDVATLSRVERCLQTLGPASEKLARVYLFRTAGKRDTIKEERHKVLFDELMDKVFGDFTPVPARDAGDHLEIAFHRVARKAAAANDDAGDWSEEPLPLDLPVSVNAK